MTKRDSNRRNLRILTFEDLRGLRAECYIRDSTLDQRDGFGPEIQRHNEERFAEAYGLILGDRWYTEFVSGRSISKRLEFQHVLEDASLDRFDVLLVDHTSRFGRNQSECIRYKEELQDLGKIVVFVSQGIISGSDRDFVSERINETLDEQYSRNLSRYVSSGMAEKASHGYANGLPPLGYRSESVSGRKGERKVPDTKTMPILLSLLRDYASGKFSYREVANRLNVQGYRTRTGRLFSGATVKDVIANPFYAGKVAYHAGQADEEITEGAHEVPAEVKDLWLLCQAVKRDRRNSSSGRPRGVKRSFPFSRVLVCHRCGSTYHGEAVVKGDSTALRLSHERRIPGIRCDAWPRSRSVAALVEQFAHRVTTHITLDLDWKDRIIGVLKRERSSDVDHHQVEILERSLRNLRKQHLWGDLTDDEYLRQRETIDRQLSQTRRPAQGPEIPNLERAAEMLNDLPALWVHPGVSDQQREGLVRQVFHSITIDGKLLMSVEPRRAYVPLFATMSANSKLGYRGLESGRLFTTCKPGAGSKTSRGTCISRSQVPSS